VAFSGKCGQPPSKVVFGFDVLRDLVPDEERAIFAGFAIYNLYVLLRN